MSKKFRTPKRRIERIRNRINDTITTSVSEVILHTAEDAKTLVRTIFDITLVRIDDGLVSAAYDMMLQRLEAGVTVNAPAIGASLDQPASLSLLWEHGGVTNIVTASGDMQVIRLFVDLASMRKMKENDTIEWAHVSDVANAFQAQGHVTLFFKE